MGARVIILRDMANPLVIGHACAAGEAPANALAGVRACLHAGAEAMEIDVQLSADGVPVLMHDETVDRTTNLAGPLRSFTFAELQAANAGDGEPVPSLDQLMAVVAGELTVMCELKQTPGDPEYDQKLVDAVIAVIKKHEANTWSAIHSFQPAMVERARSTEARISATIISPPVRGEELDRLLGALLKRNGQALSIEHHCIDRELIIKAKRRQVTVWAWTADTEPDWARLIEAGIDGIITNVPHKLRTYLGG
jgi:glycerophosphoryl diester phosphodiesterase